MALATPGGFSRGNCGSEPCALCGSLITPPGNGWLHVVTGTAVCAGCLPDPWAPEPRTVKLDADPARPRYAGERVAAELRAALGAPTAGQTGLF
jgi:hypothetical protein